MTVSKFITHFTTSSRFWHFYDLSKFYLHFYGIWQMGVTRTENSREQCFYRLNARFRTMNPRHGAGLLVSVCCLRFIRLLFQNAQGHPVEFSWLVVHIIDGIVAISLPGRLFLSKAAPEHFCRYPVFDDTRALRVVFVTDRATQRWNRTRAFRSPRLCRITEHLCYRVCNPLARSTGIFENILWYVSDF